MALDKAAVLAVLMELAPKCREASVQFTSSECSCWAGVGLAYRAVEGMDE